MDITKLIKFIIPLFLVLLNLCIKGLFISHNSLAGDEPFSVYHAQMDVLSIIHELSLGNNPPFYEIILHFWIQIFGISELSVRFLSLIFSTVTALFIYKIGHKHLNKRIAVFSTLLFIFSNYHIGFAHEARVYALFAMLTSISMYYYLNVINKNHEKQDLIILFSSNLLLIYSHYFGFFVLLIQLLYVLINKEIRTKYCKQIMFFSAGIIALYLPNIQIIITRFLASSNGTWIQSPNGLYSVIDILRTFNNEQYGDQTFLGFKPVITGLILLLIIAGSAKLVYNRHVFKSTDTTNYIILSFIIPFTIIFLASFKIPMFYDRYLVFTTIGYYLMIGIILDYLFNNKVAKSVTSIIILMCMVLTTNPNISNKRNVRETVEKIKDLNNSNTLILISPDYFIFNFAYYFDQEIFTNPVSSFHQNNIYEKLSLKHPNILGLHNINQVNYKAWNKIIFLDAAADFSYPNNNILNTLNQNCNLISTSSFYEIFNIYEFELMDEFRINLNK